MSQIPARLLALVLAVSSARASAQDLSSLPWRAIGPASFGGRIDDIEAVPGRPGTIFVGTAGGGVFRSTNNGTTWSPVFDRDGRSTSIGDIAIAPSDPGIIWVVTGEANNRQSSTWGDGIYRSLDGGDSWKHMGLAATQHIGRVAIHPRNPSIVFVAALGHLWGPNADRGVYRTTDAGATWKKVLAGDSVTGAVDVAIDPDGRTVYAAMYQRQRRGFGFIGGGPGSGVFRSRDGGDSWEPLTVGLPAGVKGRIGIAIAPSQPSTVYAIVESRDGGVFRSDDRGSSWRRQSSLNPRPMYYSHPFIDPTTGNPYFRGFAQILRRNVEGGPRQDDLQHTEYRLVAGMRGDLDPVWSYDAFYQYGRTNFAETYLNDFSVSRLGRAIDAVAVLKAQGAIPSGNTPAEFAKHIAAETVKWAKVVKESGAKPD